MKKQAPFLKSKAIFFAVLFSVFLFNLNAQTIPPTNTGTTCNECAPPGWLNVYNTADISNTTSWGGQTDFPWIGTVSTPPNGHTTFATGYKVEEIATTITGLTVGIEYTVEFYAAQLRSLAGGTPNTGFAGILLIADGTIYDGTGNALYTHTFTANSNNWDTVSFSFIATATTQGLHFAFSNGTSSAVRGNFWNISFGADSVTGLPPQPPTNFMRHGKYFMNGDEKGMYFGKSNGGN
jgi:hypothetical protein